MKVLVACEESQRVCMEFRRLGHEAYSCDIQECSGGHPEWHIKQDVLPLINGRCMFTTCDGTKHTVNGKWDLLIAHPPCTHLCSAGQRWFSEGRKPRELRDQASDFFMKFIDADCEKICVENPVGVMSTRYKKPDQIINPYEFYDDTDCKMTCLWLKNLTPLIPTNVTPENERTHNNHMAFFNGKHYSWNCKETAVYRSKTYVGIARAMAEQWGKENPAPVDAENGTQKK